MLKFWNFLSYKTYFTVIINYNVQFHSMFQKNNQIFYDNLEYIFNLILVEEQSLQQKMVHSSFSALPPFRPIPILSNWFWASSKVFWGCLLNCENDLLIKGPDPARAPYPVKKLGMVDQWSLLSAVLSHFWVMFL